MIRMDGGSATSTEMIVTIESDDKGIVNCARQKLTAAVMFQRDQRRRILDRTWYSEGEETYCKRDHRTYIVSEPNPHKRMAA
jgi:hypothetical protein